MRTTTRNDYCEGLRRAVTLVIEHLDEPLEPARLANEAGFSLYHFHRVFRGMMGESLAEFVRRIRLERAAWRLARGGSVTDVAFDSGYESHEAFTRAFRTAFGVTPSDCRRNAQKVFELPNPTGTHYDPLGRPLVLRPLIGERKMDVEIRQSPSIKAIAIRHTGPYWQIGPVFSQLDACLQEHGLEHGPALGVFYDNPEVTPLAELKSDACVMFEGELPADPRLHQVTLAGGTFAVTTYRGPYSGLGEAWAKFIGEWFPGSGYEMSPEPCFEVYVDPCDGTIPQEQLRTELWQAIVT